MASKLRDDEIKWILSLDAKGVQGEVQKLSSVIQKLTKENTALNSEIKAAEKQMLTAEREMKKLEKAGKTTSNAYKEAKGTFESVKIEIADYKKRVQENTKAIAENELKQKQIISTMKLGDMTMNQLKRRYADLQSQLNATSKAANPEAYRKLENELKQTGKQINRLSTDSKNLCDRLNVMWGAMWANFATKLFNGLIQGVKDAFNKIKEFEQANADLASILGTTRKEISDLTEEAKRLGATTEYTASQVTLMQTELAKLGFDRQQIKDMTEDILNFATATGANLPESAALAGAAMRMFELQSTDMNRVVSTMAVGTTKSALSFSYLNNAMSTVGPVANAFGFTIEDTIALLGTLANSGFDASSAATATRNILLNLADSGGKLATELGKPIKSLDDLAPALAELKEKGVDLNTTLELTDKRSVAAFNTFIKGAGNITELRDSVTGVSGDLKAMVDERLNTVEGSVKIMQSAWEGLMLSFSGSTGIIKTVIDFIASLLGGITRLLNGTSKYQSEAEIIIKTIITLTTVGAAYWAGLKLQTLWTSSLSKGTNALTLAAIKQNSILKLTNAELAKHNALSAGARMAVLLFSAAKAALTGNITRANIAMKLFNQTLKANPLGLVLSLLAAATTAFMLFKDSSDKTANAMERVNKSLDSFNSKIGSGFSERITKQIQKQKADLLAYIETLKEQGKTQKEIDKLTASKKEFINQMEQEDMQIDVQLSMLGKAKKAWEEYADANKKSTGTIPERTAMEARARDLGISSQEAYNAAIEEENRLRARQFDLMNKKTKTTSSGTNDNDKGGNKENEIKKQLDLQLKLLENAYKERQIEIEKNKNSEWNTEIEKNNLLLDAEKNYLDNRILFLKNFHTYHEKIQAEANSKLSEDELKRLQLNKKLLEQELSEIDQNLQKKLLAESQNLLERKINQEQFEQLSDEILSKSNEDKLAATRKYGFDTFAIEKQITDNRLKNQQKADKEMLAATLQSRVNSLKALEQNQELEQKELDRKRKRGVISESKYNDEILALTAKYTALRLQIAQNYGLAIEKMRQQGVEGAEEAVKTLIEEIKRLATELGIAERDVAEDTTGIMGELEEYFSELSFDGPTEQLRLAFANTFKAINDLREKDKKSWADYAMVITTAIGGMVNAIASYTQLAFELETAALEAEKQKQLTIVGDSAEARQAVEEEYAQKELDLKKKQADADANIQTAQLWINTAMGIASAWASSMEYGIAGIVIAGILTAALLTTAGIEQSNIEKKREAIKNTTLQSSSGSSASIPQTGVRQIKQEGFAEGGLHEDGGYTGDGERYQVAGHFPDGQPYHKGEYIVANPELKDPVGYELVRKLETLRRRRTSKNAVAGFAEGGMHNSSDTGTSSVRTVIYQLDQDLKAMILENNQLLRSLKQNGIKASVVLSELQAAQTLQEKSNSTFRRTDN